MKSEKQTSRSSAEQLSRREKLLRRFVPSVLIAAGLVGGAAYANEASNDAPKTETSISAGVTTHATASSEFGGAESGWGQGTAERALREAVRKGATEAFADISAKNFSITPDEIEKIVEDLPTYDQAGEVLELANVAEVMPDEGDKLSVEAAVTVDSDKSVTYEVTDAHIEDIPNNQQ